MTLRRGVRRCLTAFMTTALVVAGVGASATAAAAATVSAAPSIDVTSKKAVSKAYVTIAKNLSVPSGWTGSVTRCTVGKNSPKHDRASLANVNWARAQSGLQPVRWDASWARQARAHALMTSANGRLSHAVYPGEKCFSTAAQIGGATSNIAFGAEGPRSVLLYLADAGRANAVVGHRRWILDPRTTRIGVGSTIGASAMKVFDGGVPDAAGENPRFLPWPTAGYFPYEAEPAGRWSLSAPGADFSRARVVVRSQKGKKLALTQAPDAPGYGPSTIAWDLRKWVAAPRGTSTATYTVTVRGIRWPDSEGPSTYRYKVRLINATKIAGKR